MAKGIYERKGKNGEITYYIRYQFKTIDSNGGEVIKDLKEKVGRKSRGCTREMAKEALKAREGEITQGRFNLEKVRKPHPISELIERYHKHAASYKASYSRERYALEGFKKYFSGYLSDITPWVIEKWKRAREGQVEKSTVNRELTVLKHMLKMAVKWDLMPSNPGVGVSPFPVQEGRIRYLSETEIPALLAACEKQVTSPWLYPLVVLALNTGARQGELLQLRHEDLDLERGLIYFGRTKNRKLKTVPMNRAVRSAIEWLAQHRYGEFLFMWPWSEEIGRTTVYESFKKACQAAAIEGFRFHDLRHTAASYLVMGGVDLATVKEILGHREIEMTLRYSHLAPAHKASAMDKLGEALEAAGKSQNSQVKETEEPAALTANLAQNRNIFLVRSGRGLSVIDPKTKEKQGVSLKADWWRRGESNPRPKVFHQI
jgi:integrase